MASETRYCQVKVRLSPYPHWNLEYDPNLKLCSILIRIEKVQIPIKAEQFGSFDYLTSDNNANHRRQTMSKEVS